MRRRARPGCSGCNGCNWYNRLKNNRFLLFQLQPPRLQLAAVAGFPKFLIWDTRDLGDGGLILLEAIALEHFRRDRQPLSPGRHFDEQALELFDAALPIGISATYFVVRVHHQLVAGNAKPLHALNQQVPRDGLRDVLRPGSAIHVPPLRRPASMSVNINCCLPKRPGSSTGAG